MSEAVVKTGYPSIDRPWDRYFDSVDGGNRIKVPTNTMFEYMQECNVDNMDEAAVDFFGSKLTYREMIERAEKTAVALREMDVQAGDIISICTVNCVESFDLMYGANKAGIIFDYLSFLSEHKALVKYFEENESKKIFVLDLFAQKILDAAKEAGKADKVIVIDLADEMKGLTKMGYKFKTRKQDKSYYNDPMVMKYKDFLALGEGKEYLDYQKDPKLPCALAHTGGTTGFPKAVLLNDAAFNGVAAVYNTYQPRKPGMKYCLNTISPIVVYGYSVGQHMPMCLGHTTSAIMPKFEPDKWPEYFKKYHPSYIVTIPAFLIPMLEDKGMDGVDMSELMVLGVGGDGCTNAFEADVNAFIQARGCEVEVVKGYGMTEVGASACTTYPSIASKGEYAVNAMGSVGFPHPINEFVIWDNENNRECKYDEVGEICMHCATEMIEYRNQPEETEKIHKVHPDGKAWIHTGDLGYFNEDGLLFISGRMKRIIMTYQDSIGYKVFPIVPEEALAMHPAVQDICVVAMNNDKDNRLKAFISLKAENELDEATIEKELRELATNELNAYECPYLYEFRANLPLTPVGKVDYKKLEKQA